MLDVRNYRLCKSSFKKRRTNKYMETLTNNNKSLNNNSVKRLHSASSDESINDSEIVKNKELASQSFELPAPTFLVFMDTEKGKSFKVSPFVISKVITGRAGPVSSIRKLENGTILVKTNSISKVCHN